MSPDSHVFQPTSAAALSALYLCSAADTVAARVLADLKAWIGQAIGLQAPVSTRSAYARLVEHMALVQRARVLTCQCGVPSILLEKAFRNVQK